MTGPDPAQYGWWLASRASGVVALGLVTASVAIGLTMAGKVMRRPGHRPQARRRCTSTRRSPGSSPSPSTGSRCSATAGCTPASRGILVPFSMGYRPVFTGLGILAGYLAALLGLTFYARRRIGARLWRTAHRATVVVYLLGLVHVLGAGTDAGSTWLRAFMLATGIPIALLFLRRDARPRPATAGRGARGAAVTGGVVDRRRWPRGASAASETLRRRGYDGRLTLVCAEPHLPYDRPPLSKELLAGAVDADPGRAAPRGWYAEHDVELLLGQAGGRAASARAHGSCSPTARALRYDRLLIATGSRPRRPGLLDGASQRPRAAHAAKTRWRCATVLVPGARLAVVGAGFVGQEVAATARRLGVAVTLVEAAPLPLAARAGRCARAAGWRACTPRRASTSASPAPSHASTATGASRRSNSRRRAGRDAMPCSSASASSRRPAGCEAAASAPVRCGSTLRGHRGARRLRRRRCRRRPTTADAAAAHWEAAARQGAPRTRDARPRPARRRRPRAFWSDQYGMRLQLVGTPGGARPRRPRWRSRIAATSTPSSAAPAGPSPASPSDAPTSYRACDGSSPNPKQR